MPDICCLNGRKRGRSHPWLESCPKVITAEKPGHYKEVARTCWLPLQLWHAARELPHPLIRQLTQFTAITCLAPASSLRIKVLTYG